jgi:ABC-type sugar transport system permease subunit/ABC-type glycerol-3-phosphate transport system substrate-binding protein
MFAKLRSFTFLLIAILISSYSVAADKVLRLSVWDGDKALETIRELCGDFEKLNPGVKVRLEPYPDYNLFHQKMLITYAAGVAPDVAMMDMANFQRLAIRKAILPLNSFFEKTPGFDIKDYYKEIVDALSFRDQVYVLPRDIAPIGIIYYNKRMFKEAGIPYPDGTWTWDFKIRPELKEKDFLWVCQQFSKKEASGKYKQWGYGAGWPSILADMFAFSTGAVPYNDRAEPTKVLANDPRYVRAYQFAADFSNKLHLAPTNTDTSTVMMATTQQLFVQQKIAMYQNGIWEVPNMRRTLITGSKEFFDWDLTLAPSYANGPGGKPFRRTTTGGSGYAVFSSTKYPDLAWKLTHFLGGEPGMTKMAQAGIAQPAIKELATRPGVWCPGPNTPKAERYPENRIATHEAVQFVNFDCTSQYARTVSDRLNRGLELLWNEQKDAKTIFAENNKLGQDRLDALRREEGLPLFNWSTGLIIGLAIVAALVFWVFKPEFKNKLTPISRGEASAGFKFISPWVIGILVFTLGPMILSLLMAFADWDIIADAKYRGLGNFKEAFTEDPSFYKSLTVTIIYTVFSVPLGIMGSMGLAILLNQKVKGVSLFRTLYYIPSVTSAVAAALIWRRLLNPESGLLNYLLYGPKGDWALGKFLSNVIMHDPLKPVDWLAMESTALPALIIMSLWGIGGGTVVFLAGLQGIPQYYYEAATLDGASIIQRFKTITLPLLTPTIFFTLITGLIGAFQAFSQAYIMTKGGPNDATRFYVFHLFTNAFESIRMGYSSALGWVLFAIVLLFTVLQIKGSKWVYYEADTK